MSDLEITRIHFTKGQLKEIPEIEVFFVIQVANLLQDLSVLQKLIYMSSMGVDEDLERMAENFQALFICRILAATLYEGWKIISHRKYEGLIQMYCHSLNNEAKNSHREIREYFGEKNNLIETLRNKFASHYDFDSIRKSWRSIGDSEPLDMLIAREHANCRYTACDIVVNKAMLDFINKEDRKVAMDTLLKEIFGVTKKFLNFAGECIKVFAERCPELDTEDVTLRNVPNLDELRLHYFVTRPKRGMA